MQAGQWRNALTQIDARLALEPQNAALLLQRAQCLMGLGLRAEALAAARAAERSAPTDAALRDAVGTLYSFVNDHASALLSFDAALKQQPNHPQYLYNRATVRRSVGDLEGAERDYDAAIELSPTDFEAIKNRSDLRVQTLERNHIAQLQQLTDRIAGDWRGEVQLRYSLAKELEDLAQYPQSFAQLSQAAKVRRAHMRYDAAMDLHTVQWIMQAFSLRAAAANCRRLRRCNHFCDRPATQWHHVGRAKSWAVIRPCSPPANWTASPSASSKRFVLRPGGYSCRGRNW